MVFGSVALLLGGYVGAYYATVKPAIAYATSGHGSMFPYPAPAYPAIPWARPFFEPMYRIDCKLRPKFWKLRLRAVGDEEEEDEDESIPVIPSDESGNPS